MGLKGGGSMTAIDLTHDQCAALADYLKDRVELCQQGYDLIELLVRCAQVGHTGRGGYGERCA